MIRKKLFDTATTPIGEKVTAYDVTPENNFCLNCDTKKHPTCDGNCEDYKKFLRERRKAKK